MRGGAIGIQALNKAGGILIEFTEAELPLQRTAAPWLIVHEIELAVVDARVFTKAAVVTPIRLHCRAAVTEREADGPDDSLY